MWIILNEKTNNDQIKKLINKEINRTINQSIGHKSNDKFLQIQIVLTLFENWKNVKKYVNNVWIIRYLFWKRTYKGTPWKGTVETTGDTLLGSTSIPSAVMSAFSVSFNDWVFSGPSGLFRRVRPTFRRWKDKHPTVKFKVKHTSFYCKKWNNGIQHKHRHKKNTITSIYHKTP